MREVEQHVPVLLNECKEVFKELDLTVFFDGTLGAGGHAKALLEEHGEIENYIGCDQDEKALQIAKDLLQPWREKMHFVKGNFCNIDHHLDALGLKSIDGALFDVGISSMQLNSKERGFSFRYDAPLDMRMDSQNPLTAEKVVNELSEKALDKIFWEYGEEKKSRKVAKAIVSTRKKKKIRTTKDLLTLIEPIIYRRGKIHPATKIFQALRIYVNDELNLLQEGIEKAIGYLRKGGRIGVISFHSLEDRIVKNIFRSSEELEQITKKPITPSYEERRKNPRSRSAKGRFAEKR